MPAPREKVARTRGSARFPVRQDELPHRRGYDRGCIHRANPLNEDGNRLIHPPHMSGVQRRGPEFIERGEPTARTGAAREPPPNARRPGRGRPPTARPSRIFPVSGLDEVHGLKEVDLRFERETMIGA
jgi:hypothetical protein